MNVCVSVQKYRVKWVIDPQFIFLFDTAGEDVDEGSVDSDITPGDATNNEFPDRQHIERRLLRKIDLRMSILVLIYVLNLVGWVVT